MRHSVSAIIFIALTSFAVKGGAPMVSPTVSEIEPYVYPANRARTVPEFAYMPDGTTYVALDSDKRSIVSIDARTGKQTGVFVDLTHTRETTIPDADGFILSPDASKVLIYRNAESIYRRSKTAEYYVYEVRSRLLKPLSTEHPRQQSPIFSPDSRMVAFAADNNIYIKKIDYNSEVAVTTDGARNAIINGTADWTYEEEFTTTCSMSWAPDNSALSYLKYDETDVPVYTLPVYEGTCNRHSEYAYYPGAYSYKYPVAGRTNSKVSLHSYDVETRKTNDIALPDARIEYIPRIAYAGTAANLIVATLNRDQNRLEIYNINPKSTVAKSIYVEESSAWIAPETYETLHIGDKSFVINSSKSGYNNLYQYSYTGSQIRQITAGEADVTAYYGCDASGNHYYQIAAPTPLDRSIRRIDAKGRVTDIVSGDGTASATFSPDMGYMVMCRSDIDTPPVYTMCNNAGKMLWEIETNRRLADMAASLPDKKFFTMTSDGNELNGYIIYPKNFSNSSRYPAIMYQYSGPGSQEVLNRWSLDWQQYFADKGFVVICVDGRGTGGRGRAFMDVVYRNLGHYETIDQLAAARYAASLPFVDPARIGIFGWSYGGYETLMAATADDAPYAAAVAVAPVTDWRYYDTVYAERYMLTPQQNESGYNSSSPLNRALHLACPTLLMYGSSDDNVHPENTLQFASTLQSAGIMFDMMTFPNMNHSINGCNARAYVYAKMYDYFTRHLTK